MHLKMPVDQFTSFGARNSIAQLVYVSRNQKIGLITSKDNTFFLDHFTRFNICLIACSDTQTSNVSQR